MKLLQGRTRRPLLLAKVVGATAAMLLSGVAVATTATPASAASCQTKAHVYKTDQSPWSIRYEDDAADRPADDYQNFGNSNGQTFTVFFRLGGNGLLRDSIPSWDVRSNTGTQFTLFGNKAGSNCVANERNFSRGAGVPGEIWTVTANYNGGNSGALIRNQTHFRIIFVEAPPVDPPDDPCYPYYCL